MRILLFAIFSVVASKPAHAYLDPGTGSMLLYAVIGLAATAIYTLRGFYYRVSHGVLGGVFFKRHQIPVSDVVFYSEGKQYWDVFAPVIRALEAKEMSCVYLSSGRDDPGLACSSRFVKPKYLGGLYRSAAHMNNISAKIVVMTTPQLDVLTLRRSNGVRHYAHLIHSPTDVLLYKKYAFDYFDSIFCSGPHQKANLRKLEQVRSLSRKSLFDTGCTYYDEMLTSVQEVEFEPLDKLTVLVAPTWGRNSCLARYGAKPLRSLLRAGFHVILRLHPQSYISEPELVDAVLDEVGRQDNFEIDDSASNIRAMARSNILVSDVSGIIFDYAFVFEKPVLIIDSEVERGGYEAEDIDSEIWELAIRDRLGRRIAADELDSIGSIATGVLAKDIKPEARKIRAEYCYNFGKSGEIAAEQIISLLAEVK